MDAEQVQQLLPAAVFVVVMVGLFWWIVVRPTKKREQRHKDLIQSIVPGEKVITVGGIYGKIARVHENAFELEVTKGITMTFDRRAVRRRQDEDS